MKTIMGYLDNADLREIRANCKERNGKMIGTRHYDAIVSNDENGHDDGKHRLVFTSYWTDIASYDPDDGILEWLSNDIDDYSVTTLKGLNAWIAHSLNATLTLSKKDMRRIQRDGWNAIPLWGTRPAHL